MQKIHLLLLTFSITLCALSSLRAMEISMHVDENAVKAFVNRIEVLTKKLNSETLEAAREKLQLSGLQGQAAAIDKKTIKNLVKSEIYFKKMGYKPVGALTEELKQVITTLEKCTDEEAAGILILLNKEFNTIKSKISAHSTETEHRVLSFTDGVDLEDDSQKECSIQ